MGDWNCALESFVMLNFGKDPNPVINDGLQLFGEIFREGTTW